MTIIPRIFLLGLFLFLLCTTGIAQTQRVSVGLFGLDGNNGSGRPAISSEGRYVAFQSSASNLVPNDANGVQDIFVHDRQTNITTCVSMNSNGAMGNGTSHDPAISSNGRYVAFTSGASNLVSGDTNGVDDIFVHDLQTGLTTRVSESSGGIQANGGSNIAACSGDGQYIVFISSASNLVAGDTNGARDIFVRDIQTGTTNRVNVSSSGAQMNSGNCFHPSISASGRYVVFGSSGSNLVLNDTNNKYDVFLRDIQLGITTRLSVDLNGNQGNGDSGRASISADGLVVCFKSTASNLVVNDTNGTWDIFVHEVQSGLTTRVSVGSGDDEGDDESQSSSISADGRYIVFGSKSQLVAGDTNHLNDIFVHDRQTGITSRVSNDTKGNAGNGGCSFPFISGDGTYVVFGSGSSNLIANDTNGKFDVFVRNFHMVEESTLPIIVSVFPATVGGLAGNVTIFLSGSGFVDGAIVKFGGVPAISTVFINSGLLKVIIPTLFVGVYDITITNPGIFAPTVTLAGSFTSVNGTNPVVASATPSVVPYRGGDLVSINGSGFQGGADVIFFINLITGLGGTGVLPDSILSNVIQVKTLPAFPAAFVGNITILIINPDGLSAPTFGVLYYAAIFSALGTLNGTIAPVGNIDPVFLDAVAGTKITATLVQSVSMLEPKLQLKDAKQTILISTDSTDASFDPAFASATSKSALIKNFILNETGRYRFDISGLSGSTGKYKFTIKETFPATAKSVKVSKVPVGGAPGVINFAVKAGATIKGKLTASKGLAINVAAFSGPSGSILSDPDVSSKIVVAANGLSIQFNDVPLDSLGEYSLTIASTNAAVGTISGSLKIMSPKLPTSLTEH